MIKMDFLGVSGKVVLAEIDVLVTHISGGGLGAQVWHHQWQVSKQQEKAVAGVLWAK